VLIPETIRRSLSVSGTVTILGGGVLLVLLVLLGSILVGKAQQTYSADFTVFYVSGVQFFEGKDVYASLPFDFLGPIPDGVPTPARDMHANLNPPFSVLLLAPLSRLPFAYAYLTWSLLSFICAFAAAWLMADAYTTGQRRLSWSIGLLVLLLAYSPTWSSFVLGQTTLPVLLILAAGWRLTRNGHEPGAGAVLGAALAMKPFVGVLLIYFLALRRWRLLAWYGASFAAANLIALGFMGVDVFARYLDVLRTVTWHGMDLNASLFGLLARLTGNANGPSGQETGQWMLILGYGISLVLLGLLILLCRRLPPWPSPRGIDIGYAGCLVLMLLISPLGWVYYFPILLICILVIFQESRTLPRAWLYRTAAGAAWLVTGVLYFVVADKHGAKIPYSPFHIPDVYTGALLLIAVTLALLGRRVGGKSGP
jgi:hypothetical protein